MIIKLAQFESELEKEAASFTASNANRQVREIANKIMRGRTVSTAEAALLDAHVAGGSAAHWGKGRVASAGRGLDYVGNRLGEGVNNVLGVDVSGKAAGATNRGLAALRAHKTKIVGGAALAGTGALLYKKDK